MAYAHPRAVQPVLAALFCLWTAAAQAQSGSDARADTVSWSVTAQEVAKPNARLTVTLHGTVQDGWHVYGLKQHPEGPTPLRVDLEANPAARADGAVTESPPIKIFEPAFGVETPIHAKAFTITVPVRLRPHLAAGPQTLPVRIRFQTCNGAICQPPKTVHLSATVNLQAAG